MVLRKIASNCVAMGFAEGGRVMRKFAIPTLVFALSSCGTGSHVASEEELANQAARRAREAVADQQSHMNRINTAMAALAGHQADDPIRTDALIRSCQSQLGVRMEGEGAYSIVQCVNRRWSEVSDLTDAARSVGYDDTTSRRLGEQAAAICNGDPDCLK